MEKGEIIVIFCEFLKSNCTIRRLHILHVLDLSFACPLYLTAVHSVRCRCLVGWLIDFCFSWLFRNFVCWLFLFRSLFGSWPFGCIGFANGFA